ncbi:hypothetical protein [Paraburkholderia ultramafica]|nr:hypothetical protein [Paraburkholderia ultramafica]
MLFNEVFAQLQAVQLWFERFGQHQPASLTAESTNSRAIAFSAGF